MVKTIEIEKIESSLEQEGARSFVIDLLVVMMRNDGVDCCRITSQLALAYLKRLERLVNRCQKTEI